MFFFSPHNGKRVLKKPSKIIFSERAFYSVSQNWNWCFNNFQNYQWIFYSLSWNSEPQMSSKPKALPRYMWWISVYIHCIKIDNLVPLTFILEISLIFWLYWHSLLCLFQISDIFSFMNKICRRLLSPTDIFFSRIKIGLFKIKFSIDWFSFTDVPGIVPILPAENFLLI